MKKKATALTLVLVVMIILGLGTTALLQARISYSQMSAASITGEKARYLAEAGMQYAAAQLRNGDTTSPVVFPAADVPAGWTVTVTKTNLGGGSYRIDSVVQYP